MGVQEIIVFTVVLIAGIFTAKKVVRQLTHGDSGEKCGKCELNKAVSQRKS